MIRSRRRGSTTNLERDWRVVITRIPRAFPQTRRSILCGSHAQGRPKDSDVEARRAFEPKRRVRERLRQA